MSLPNTASGTFPPSGALSMGGHQLNSVGDATSATDALNRESGDARYVKSPLVMTFGNMVAPVLINTLAVAGTQAPAASNRLYMVRCVVPYAGTLTDLYAWIGSSGSGNAIGAVFDDNSTKNRLWQGSTTATTSTNAWVNLGNPALTVTAGQHVDLGIVFDNTTVTFGRTSIVTPAAAQMPTNFFPAPDGALPKLSSLNDVGSFSVPGTIAEGSVQTSAIVAYLISRVV